METLTAIKFRFGNFEMDCVRRILASDGKPLTLNSKAFDLLRHLIENQGSVLSKDELMTRVWPDQFVEENNLTVHISALRKALSERKNEHRYIITVPGRGYTFAEKVERVAAGLSACAVDKDDSFTKDNGRNALQIASSVGFERGDSIFGRAVEITELKLLLRDAGQRLMVLTGPGGSGKTSLARAVAAESAPGFADGVDFVELAEVQEPDLVAPTIIRSLGLKESAETPPLESLKAYLHDRQMLLILDNFEQLISAAPLVKEILASSHSLKILVTSRVALRLNLECEFAVGPLRVPPRDHDLSAQQFAEYASITLFIARAQKANQSFALTDANAADVAEICRRLDGLPLAIELAAARVKLLSARSILSRLENSLNLLTGGAVDSPERHRTIRGTIEWSYDLLSADESAMFQRLAVFAGGFSVAAAETIANATLTNTPLDLLTSLIDNNLLVSKEQPDGDARLHMLEVVREFAIEYLEKSGEAAAVRASHAHFFLDFAEEAAPQLFSGRSVEWLATLDAEHDNLRAAFDWLIGSEPLGAARLVVALDQFWINRGYLNEARRWLEAALDKIDMAPSAIRLKLLNLFSLVARNQGDYAATRRASEESLAASRATNDLPQIILSCHAVAALETREGNFKTARKLIEEALKISRRLGDEKQIAFSLSFLGNLFLAQSDAAGARGLLEESLAICRRLDYRVNVCTNLVNLGTAAYYEGEIDAAERHFAEAMTICREMGIKILESCCLDGYAAVSAMRGDPRQAAFLAGAAQCLRDTIGYEIEPTETVFCDSYLDKVRSAIDEKTFDAFHQQGSLVDPDQTVALIAANGVNGAFAMPGDNAVDDDVTEVIIENRSFSRIVIEE